MKKILKVAVVVISGFVAGAVVAQIGLRVDPEIFTTLIGTYLVIATMISVGVIVDYLLSSVRTS